VSSCCAIRVMSRQLQAQELKRPPPVHAWNHLEPTSFIPVADRWTTQLSQNGDEISCSLPASLVGVLQGMWRDSVARGCRYLCVLEICYNGEKRQLTTKHKPEKYNTYAGNIADLVSREFSFMAMEQMHCSRHYSSLSKAPRRLGACEVYLLMPDGVDNSQSCVIFLGHSKLSSLQWPNCSNLRMRFLNVLPNIVRRVLELRSHDWSVHEGQAVMKEAAAWGLERWDALEGLADKVDAGNRVLESGQQASRSNDKDALREAIQDCHELQLADELIEGWMDELKQKNMSVFNLKSQAKRFQRNAAFSAAVRVLNAAVVPPLRLASLQRALLKAQQAELPEGDIAEAADLQSRVEDTVHNLRDAMETRDLFEVAKGIDEMRAMEIEDDLLESSEAVIANLANRVDRAAAAKDLVELEDALGAWFVRDTDAPDATGTAGSAHFQTILQAEKVRISLTKQVEEAEKRYKAQRWDALKSAMDRLKDVQMQDEIWERWKNALEREQRWTVLHAVSGVAVELKRQLYARRLDSAMRAQEISLAQLEEVVAAAAAHQVHPTSVEKARAEIDTAKQRCRDAQGAAENRLVDRADAMLWKLKKGRIRMDDWTKREGPLWDMVNAIQEAEGAQDWQAMQAAIAGWREERPGSNHEAFEDPWSPTRLFRRAQERCGELRLKEFRQEVNDILNRFKDPSTQLPAAEAQASLRRAATLVREMLQLGWEMTPARNARLLLALGKATAEGGREASLARFTAALLQMSEGFPMLLFVVDCSGAKKCGTEAGVERAVAAMAECLQRHAAGVTCGVITYSPAEVVQELGPDLPSLTAALAAARRQDEVEVAKALRSAKEQLKLGKKGLTENGDKQPIVIHIAASHAGNAKDSGKAMKVLEALGVMVLGLGMGDIKVDALMKMSSPGLAFRVEGSQLANFVEEGCQEVERVLKASKTQNPEDILRQLEAGKAE